MVKGRPDESAYEFMRKEAVSLASLLQHYSLSDRGKIHLAHCLSWAVWQYYDSKWMCHRWTSDEVHFIPPDGRDDITFHQGSLDAMSPHIKVKINSGEGEFDVLHSEYAQHRLLHPAPRIHALGVMLANIFGHSIEGPNANPVAFYNHQQLHYRDKLPNDWPRIEADSSRLRAIIKEATLACFDKTLSGKSESSLTERREYLFNKIVWPLRYLAVEVYPASRASWYPKDKRRSHDMTAYDDDASTRHRPDDSQSTPPCRPKNVPSLSAKPRSDVETCNGTAVFGITGNPTIDQDFHETRLLRTEGKARGDDFPIDLTPSGTFGIRYVRTTMNCA